MISCNCHRHKMFQQLLGASVFPLQLHLITSHLPLASVLSLLHQSTIHLYDSSCNQVNPSSFHSFWKLVPTPRLSSPPFIADMNYPASNSTISCFILITLAASIPFHFASFSSAYLRKLCPCLATPITTITSQKPKHQNLPVHHERLTLPVVA